MRCSVWLTGALNVCINLTMADVTSHHRREILALLKSVYLVSFILFIGSFIFGNFGLNHLMLWNWIDAFKNRERRGVVLPKVTEMYFKKICYWFEERWGLMRARSDEQWDVAEDGGTRQPPGVTQTQVWHGDFSATESPPEHAMYRYIRWEITNYKV